MARRQQIDRNSSSSSFALLSFIFSPSRTMTVLLKRVLFFSLVSTLLTISLQQEQPVLNSAEQDLVYRVLSSINPAVPWRSLFPDYLCSYPPHGVVCDYFTDPNTKNVTVHVTELSFGYVSDFTPNPPCSPNSTFSPLLVTSFKQLRKLFFYQCFTETPVFIPKIPTTFGSSLEEFVFINNPAFVGPISGIIRNFTSLRRLVLTGNGIYGSLPDAIGDLVNVEEITLSRNKLSGNVSVGLSKLKKLKVLDLSDNGFNGNVPCSVGNLTELLKLDLSSNGFSGKIPESLSNLQALELLDLSFNSFGNFGVPLFLAGMPRLKEVHLSGNLLGGEIPEIWENLGGILGIGFSNMGLVGEIPASMGVHLRNMCYLSLDNNKLQGKVPKELGNLEFVKSINLENNNLSGRIPFSAKVGEKLRLKGNPELCADEKWSHGKNFGELKKCCKPDISKPVFFIGTSHSRMLSSSSFLVLLLIWALFIVYV
ncbi:piriformospora indica-insensitive protein 2-like [Hibiscus syriacus]|uniref:piriformospora indica-insensitive protein 2-like n=1 Tax=Hibiscus syriacus TaxID=106335 RepID=UPI00192295F4|nr:piriformospora indica-insensitive protein 2-like [Hibiscus syriacus]